MRRGILLSSLATAWGRLLPAGSDIGCGESNVNPSGVKRRHVLQTIGVAATTVAVPATRRVGGVAAGASFAIRQGDRCASIEPLRGEVSVDELYDYAYPTGEYSGALGSDGVSFSSEGTVDLQRDNSSILFLYEGPDGLSLVVLHGRLHGEIDGGGTVSFVIHGLPTDGDWVVMDDYLEADGEEVSEDWWDVDGDVHDIDWAYEPGETDGGAFRALDAEFDAEIVIEPAFNEMAYLADEYDYGSIERWEVLSGDIEDPDRYALELDEEVAIRSKPCKTADEIAKPKKEEKKPEKAEKKPKKEKAKKEEKPKKKKPEKKKPKKEKPEKEEAPKKEKPKKEKPEKEEAPKKEKPKKEKAQKKEEPKKEKP
ncbi:hypothetical protein, partial [Halovivax sp.]|uniref:hypothetical protein n=1 Tax=Halovivax sp. TaxID=1935978 RepID=UPI0037448953